MKHLTQSEKENVMTKPSGPFFKDNLVARPERTRVASFSPEVLGPFFAAERVASRPMSKAATSSGEVSGPFFSPRL